MGQKYSTCNYCASCREKDEEETVGDPKNGKRGAAPQ